MDQSKNIYQRMIEVQKSVKTVLKNDTIKMREDDKGYKAVSHDDVAALLHLPLAEAGIVLIPDVVDFSTTEFEVQKQGYGNKPGYVQRWYRTDIKILVKWINADKPEDFIQSTGAAFALDTSDKGFAKAYSLALKIVLLKVHLLESRDDEEKRTIDGPENDPPDPKTKAPKEQGKPQSQFVKPIPEQFKPPENKSIVADPGQYMMPLGSADVLGKKIVELSESKLRSIVAWTTEKIKDFPPPENLEKIIEVDSKIKEFFKSVGV